MVERASLGYAMGDYVLFLQFNNILVTFFELIIKNYTFKMNKKNFAYKLSPQPSLPLPSSLPNTIKLKNLTNFTDSNEILSLKLRIDELQNKVTQLQGKMKSKRKRIRRKSNEVEKRHKCQFCRKPYGSLVSLNLHLRLKHRRQKIERQRLQRQKAKQISQKRQKEEDQQQSVQKQ